MLEIGDNRYTRRFGGDRVLQSDVLHVRSDNPAATIVADLTNAEHIPSNAFDCLIITQTLQHTYDIRPAVRTLHRILKPNGILLATFSGISQIARRDMELWGECWHFTTLSTERLLEQAFRPGAVQVEAHGNVLAAIALLHGLASHELRKEQLDMQDPDYQVHRYSPSDKERVKACLLRGCQRVSERLFRITGREDRAAVRQAP